MRTAKFVAREHWIVCGSDDKFIRVFDYNTMESVKEFEAHEDYIRSLAVHPTFPFVLTASDDKLIKLWDWEKNWECTQTFEGHSHYVMQSAFNPKDLNTFASASLDGTIQVLDTCPLGLFATNLVINFLSCVKYVIYVLFIFLFFYHFRFGTWTHLPQSSHWMHMRKG